MKKSKIHIGCSAFNNSYWKGIFYPEDLPRSKWFDYYAQHFHTYELNASFYRWPTLKSLQSWYDKAPDGFSFSVKVHKSITHYRRMKDCQAELDQFYSVCRDGLKQKLGCVLFQLPPSFAYSAENLTLVIENLNPDFENVVEFRNETWWNAATYEAFNRQGITFCNVNYPKLPEALVVTTEIGYIRLHGRKKLFYSTYPEADLKQYCKMISEQTNLKSIYVYFNNTADVFGIENALWMQQNCDIV